MGFNWAFNGLKCPLTLTLLTRRIWVAPNNAILILSTHLSLGLPSGLLPSGFPTRPYTPPVPNHTRYMPSTSGPNNAIYWHY